MLFQLISLILGIILVILLVRSCNFHQLVDKALSKKFKHYGMVSKTLNIGEHTSLQYWHGGQGKPLLLLHGFGATAKYQWEKQLKAFLKEYQLIIPNLIYFGESRSQKGEFSIDFQVNCMQQLVEHLQLDNFSLIGLSYGGVVGITLANKLPHRVQKLVICGSPIRYYTEEDIAATLQRYEADSIENLLIPPAKSDLRKLLKIAFHRPPPLPKFVQKDVYEGLFSHQKNEKRKLLTYLYEHRTELSTMDFDLTCPILLIWGVEDRLIPTKIGEQLHDYFGAEQASFVTIENTAHMPNIERPKVYNKLVLSFLNNK